MSNVFSLFNHARHDCTATGRATKTTAGIRSLSESWRSTTESVHRLEDFLDDLKPFLAALPDGCEKQLVRIAMQATKMHVQSAFVSSTKAIAAVALIKERPVSK